MESCASVAAEYTLDDIHNGNVLDLHTLSQANGYDSICLPLTTDKWKADWIKMCLLPGDKRESRRFAPDAEKVTEKWRKNAVFDKDHVTIASLDEAVGVVAIVSQWLPLDDPDEWIRYDAAIAFQQEVSYASYLNITNAILPPPRNRQHVSSYARVINTCLETFPFLSVTLRLPVYDPQEIFSASGGISTSEYTSSYSFPSSSSSSTSLSSTNGSPSRSSDPFNFGPPSPMALTPRLVVHNEGPDTRAKKSNDGDTMWEMWDLIRSICSYNPRLFLALDLTLPLPPNADTLQKWKAEPIRYIFIPAATFIANSKGYPVLPKATQKFVRDCMIHQPTFVLSNTSAGLHLSGGEGAYLQYIQHLEKTSPAVQNALRQGTVENFANGYQDYLQAPLQPLKDNLTSGTYQTFEQDPVKYRNYEEAIYKALVDWPNDDIIIIFIVGAGRGGIVSRCLSAIQRSDRDAFIYAIEKNPNAYVTLQNRRDAEWGDKVNLIFGDMRYIQVREKADIIISELLGSFGDNELSPECLDGAMRFLKPDGISIPSSYTAHLAPVSSSKLWNSARADKETRSMETPYVVMFQAVSILSGDADAVGRCGSKIQECWEFEHPTTEGVVRDSDTGLPMTNGHNTRAAKLNFSIPNAGVLHGLAGYFEAVLYGNIGLSIHPLRKDQISKDMLSWFPLFFPFKEPLYLPANSELSVSIWRLTDDRQVWYEWHAESFMSVYVPASGVGSSGNSLSRRGSKGDVMVAGSPSLRGSHGILPSSPSLGMPSPLVDAIDIEGVSPGRQPAGWKHVKIGQTSLHNAGGKSSYMGL